MVRRKVDSRLISLTVPFRSLQTSASRIKTDEMIAFISCILKSSIYLAKEKNIFRDKYNGMNSNLSF